MAGAGEALICGRWPDMVDASAPNVPGAVSAPPGEIDLPRQRERGAHRLHWSSLLARQVDGIVRKPERDLPQQKVGEA
jgi:hypothetical protein